MPVQKFRTLEEMNAADRDMWCDEPDDAYLERVRQLWRRSALLNPRSYPKGVRKYRTLEEAQAERDRWLTEHVQKLQREREEQGTMRVIQRPKSER